MVAWCKVLSFTDPYPYQAAIRAADLELFPTARGEFRAELTQICVHKLWMQRAHESLPRVWVGTVSPSRRVIGFLADVNDPGMTHCGMNVSPGDMIVNRTDVLHRRTKAACDWGSMSLALDDFAFACKAITGHEFPAGSPMDLVRPSPVLMSRLLNAHASAALMAKTNPDVLASAEVARALEEQLTRLLVRCLMACTAVERSVGNRRHDRVVARFEEYLEANRGKSLYLTEICAAIGVPERTLRGACEEYLGMGPIRVSDPAKNASGPPRAVGLSSFGNIGHTNCHRSRILGVGTLRCRLPGLVWRDALGIVATTIRLPQIPASVRHCFRIPIFRRSLFSAAGLPCIAVRQAAVGLPAA